MTAPAGICQWTRYGGSPLAPDGTTLPLPVIDAYVDFTGTPVTPPAGANGVTLTGNGVFRVLPSSADILAGRAMRIDNGAGFSPRYEWFAISSPATPARGFAFIDNLGAPWAGVAATLTLYKDSAGATPGAGTGTALLTPLGPEFPILQPPAPDLANGLIVQMTPPADVTAVQVYYDEEFLVLSGPTPPPPAVLPAVGVPYVPVLVGGADPNAYGIDVKTWPQLSASFELINGPYLVAERLYRRLTTPRGFLWYAPADGFDVRALLNRASTAAGRFQIQHIIAQESKKDEAVDQVSVVSSWNAIAQALTLQIAGTLIGDPSKLKLTLLVSKLSVSMVIG